MSPRLKAVLRDLAPPLLWRALQKILAAPPKLEPSAWRAVTGGPLEGAELLLPQGRPGFDAMLRGEYDAFFWPQLSDLELEGKLLVDVGAHIGYHALAFARLAGPGGLVLAFEPNPANRERLQLHLDRNPGKRAPVEVSPLALSDAAGEAVFRASRTVEDQTSSGGYLDGAAAPAGAADYHAAGFGSFAVDTATMDAVLSAYDRPPALIKIDVEGAEGAVLRGGRGALARTRPFLLIEIHSAEAMLEVARELLPAGYEITILERDRPARCFICARFAG